MYESRGGHLEINLERPLGIQKVAGIRTPEKVLQNILRGRSTSRWYKLSERPLEIQKRVETELQESFFKTFLGGLCAPRRLIQEDSGFAKTFLSGPTDDRRSLYV